MPALEHGCFVVSLEMRHRPAASPHAAVLGILQEHQLPACFLYGEPPRHLRQTPVAAVAGSEIALWVDEPASRMELSRQLKRHTAQAAQFGCSFSVLAAPGERVLDFPDLLVKHRVHVVLRIGPRPSRTSFQPSLQRFGVWTAAPTLLLRDSIRRPWSRWTWTWSALRTIEDAIRRRGVVHLFLDAAATAAPTPPLLRALDRIGRATAAARRQGRLAIWTPSMIAAVLQGGPSIRRRAARAA